MSAFITNLQKNIEYQSLVPPLTKEEYEKLKEDIQKHGQLEPIKVNSKGEILDGYSRNQICSNLGITPKFEVKTFENKLLEKRYVIAANIYRRQLNTFQRVELELALEPIDKEIAKQNIIANLPTTNNTNSQNSVNRLGRQGVNESTAKRAKASHETVRQVKAILEKGSEEMKNQLRADKIKINRAFKAIKKEEIKCKLLKEAANTPFPTTEGVQLIHGDFIEKSKEIPDNSVDLIFTDPPYALEFLYLYDELAKVAERILKPGGSIIVYLGEFFLDEILTRMKSAGLTYWWILGIKYPPGHEPMFKRCVFHEWKPLLWLVKGDKLTEGLSFMPDFIQTEHPNKDLHIWAQSPIEAEHAIKRLTVENQIVFDPMMGSGTTGIEAVRLNRKFIGIEIDESHFKTAQFRIGKVNSNRADSSDGVITKEAS